MKDVTRHNFQEITREFKQAVDLCDFVAIDLEFTGLSSADKYIPSYFDDIDVFYQKVKKNTKNLQILQIGVSLTKFNKKQQKYDIETYNFNLFESSYMNNHTYFTVQTSTVPFLAMWNFDFNKCLIDGVEFLSYEKYLLYQEIIQNYSAYPEVICSIFFSESVRNAYKFIKPQINTWLEAKDQPEFRVDILCDDGAHVTGLILKILTDFEKKTMIEINGKQLLLTKLEQTIPDQNILPIFHDLLKKSYGFGELFEYIINKKKIMVLHNSLLDLLFLYEKLVSPLPETFEAFNKKINNIFPVIFDTKNMAINTFKEPSRFKTPKYTSLEYLCEYFSDYSNEDIFPKISSDIEKNLYHNAGYDSFSTAVVFIHIMHMNSLTNTQKLTNDNNLDFQNYLNSINNHKNFISLVHNLKTINLIEDIPETNNSFSYKILKLNDQPRYIKHIVEALIKNFRGNVIKTENGYVLASTADRLEKFEERTQNLSLRMYDGHKIFGMFFRWNIKMLKTATAIATIVIGVGMAFTFKNITKYN